MKEKNTKRKNTLWIGKILAYALIIPALVYLSFVTWALLKNDEAQTEQQKQLASETVPVEYDLANAVIPRPPPLEAPAGHQITSPASITAVDISSGDRDRIEQYNLQTLPNGMVISPIENLHQVTENGTVPVIRQDGLTAFNGYKAPFDKGLFDAPVISLAIMGIGLSENATDSAIRNMPAEVSLIMSPYTKVPDFWINEARANGHEVWLSLPMEPETYPQKDPGPHTLLVNGKEQDNIRKANWVMGRARGYVGFVTKPQTAFMKSPQDMRPVIYEIYNHGLGFIDGSETPSLIPQSIAHGMNAAYGTVDIWIDKVPTSAQIRKSLLELEMLAKEQGKAVGVFGTHPVSYKEIQDWIGSLKQKSIVLAPLSATTLQHQASQ